MKDDEYWAWENWKRKKKYSWDKKNFDEQMRFEVIESLNLKEKFFIIFNKKRSNE